MIRLLLVDDQTSVRQGLRMRFELETDMKIVGEAASGMEALTLAAQLEPDVVIMDVEMPQMDGITTARVLSTNMPNVGVVILSIHGDVETRTRASAAGVSAFVEKRGAADILLNAIRQAARSTD